MTDETVDLDRLLARLSEDGHSRRDPEEHPAPEKLSAYQAGELSPEEDDAIQEHLAHCGLCTELLLDLQRFLNPPPEDRPREGVANFEAAVEWRELREKISYVTPDDRAAPGLERGSRRERVKSRIAASLGILLLAPLLWFVWYSFELEQQISELRQPQGNVPTEVLESTRSEAPRLPAGRTVDLDLKTSAPQEYAKYLAEIVTQGGQRLWSGPLTESASGGLTLRIVAGFLEPGVYHIRLSGLRDGRTELLEEYLIRVVSK